MLSKLWLIPLVPLVGVAVNGLWGRRLSRRTVGVVACGTIAVGRLAEPDRILAEIKKCIS